ncbi:MAG TPA: hypothetical protein PK644_08330, partial [bacterium]|nr:hypothetical protein [bacterium]
MKRKGTDWLTQSAPAQTRTTPKSVARRTRPLPVGSDTAEQGTLSRLINRHLPGTGTERYRFSSCLVAVPSQIVRQLS